jgi:hypothetical protein
MAEQERTLVVPRAPATLPIFLRSFSGYFEVGEPELTALVKYKDSRDLYLTM